MNERPGRETQMKKEKLPWLKTKTEKADGS